MFVHNLSLLHLVMINSSLYYNATILAVIVEVEVAIEKAMWWQVARPKHNILKQDGFHRISGVFIHENTFSQ